ncbi:MAG: MFS transporter [Verrucomicrobia bacterium]|nr:MFS transporter [Verrucomicrobiota bacterium]
MGRYRWVVCALLFFATTINYMDRQILSLLKPILDDQLHWTNEQFGAVNSAFQGAYAVGALLFGYLVDRLGSKLGYSLSIVGWSLAALGHALVSSVGGFMLARVCLGISEAGNFPSSIKTVALWFPKKERTFATSLFNSGSNVGPIIAPIIIPWIALTWSWHMAFIVAGLAGFVWLVFWIPMYDEPRRQKRLSAAELAYIESDPDEAHGKSAGKVHWLSLLKYRQAWSIILARFMTDPVWWFFLIWLPDFFKKTRHLDITHSWIHLVSIYAIITVLSNVGGWLPGRLMSRGWSVTRARKTSMFIFALCVVPIIFATSVGNWPAVFLIGLAGSAHQAWSANLYTTASDMFPKRAVASLIGLGSTAGSIGGIIFPMVAGRLLDTLQAGGYTILFIICGFAYLVAFALNHLCAPRFERFPAPELTEG